MGVVKVVNMSCSLSLDSDKKRRKIKQKNPKKLQIVLVILYDGGGRYIYYYSSDVCFRFLAGEFTCAGDLVFFFSFFFFAVIALAVQCITPVIFPLLFYSQEMSRLCRPSTNVNNVYCICTQRIYTRRIYFRRAPVAIYSCSNSLYV